MKHAAEPGPTALEIRARGASLFIEIEASTDLDHHCSHARITPKIRYWHKCAGKRPIHRDAPPRFLAQRHDETRAAIDSCSSDSKRSGSTTRRLTGKRTVSPIASGTANSSSVR